MKINEQYNQNILFKGSIYNNKFLLKSLKFASEKSSLVSAGTTLACATIIRPAAIMLTPNSPKEDKQYASTKSIESGLLTAGLTASIFTPVSRAIDNISKTPQDYLKTSTIDNLKSSAKTLDASPAYNFIRQIVKISPDVFAVLPKAIITAALIVPFNNFIFNKDKKETNKKTLEKPSFKGLTSKFSNRIAKIIENEKVQNAAVKYQDTNFIQHILNLKDVYATACFSAITAFNPQMKNENKKPLIYNTAISTALTIGGSYVAAKLLDNPLKKFLENFKNANKDDANLYKYLNGIKVLKPILILSSLYYIGIPILATFGACKLAKHSSEKVASEK